MPILVVVATIQVKSLNTKVEKGFPLESFTSAKLLFDRDDSKGPTNNFFKGVKWSPDGLCLLTCNEDNVLRLSEVDAKVLWNTNLLSSETADDAMSDSDGVQPQPLAAPVLSTNVGESVYDFCWNPTMSSLQPASCYFLSTSRDHPIQLWDAFTGELRASYRAYDHVDELTSAISLAQSSDGSVIYAGYEACIRVFDVSRPGRSCESYPLTSTQRLGRKKRKVGQRGIVSCIAPAPYGDKLLAAASYSGQVCVYSQDDMSLAAEMQGPPTGVTHCVWSPDGQYLFAGGRKSGDILCWDVRQTGGLLARFPRVCHTNQRIYFDIDTLGGRFLVSGSQDGQVLFFDLTTCPAPDTQIVEPCFRLQAHGDCAAGLSLHPSFSQQCPVFATASGQRKFLLSDPELNEVEDEKEEKAAFLNPPSYIENRVSVWALLHPLSTSSSSSSSSSIAAAEADASSSIAAEASTAPSVGGGGTATESPLDVQQAIAQDI